MGRERRPLSVQAAPPSRPFRERLPSTVVLLLVLILTGAACESEASQCEDNPNPMFRHHFTDRDQIEAITPPGFVSGGFLKTHSAVWTGGAKVPLYAPHDMTLESGAYYRESDKNQYILFFQVSCQVSIKFDHVDEPVPEIRALFPTLQTDTRTNTIEEGPAFEAGKLIGHTRGNELSGNWDFGIYNEDRLNSLTGDPRLERGDEHADCPYEYFTSELREFFRAKYAGLSEDDPVPVTICEI